MICILSPFFPARFKFCLLTEYTLHIGFHKAYNLLETEESVTACGTCRNVICSILFCRIGRHPQKKKKALVAQGTNQNSSFILEQFNTEDTEITSHGYLVV